MANNAFDETERQKNTTAINDGFCNLYETLQASAKRFPDKRAQTDHHTALSYRQLLEKVDKMADFLQQQCGLGSSSKAAILQGNSIEYCVSLYSLAKIGCTAIILNPKLQGFELSNILQLTQPKTVLLQEKYLEKLLPAIQTETVSQLVFCHNKNVAAQKADALLPQASGCRCFYFADAYAWETLKSKAKLFRNPKHPALVMFTSGSTDTPKGVVITHENVLASAISYRDGLKMNEDEVTVLSVPVFHVTGLICVMALFVLIGGQIVFTPKFNAQTTLEAIDACGATHFHGVSTVYLMLQSALLESDKNYNLQSLRMAVCGGGAVSDATIRSLKEYIPKLDFRPAYGLTETAGAGVIFPCDYDLLDKHRSAGRVVPGCTITIRSQERTLLPTGEVGEVCIEGAMVTPGYLGKPLFKDGVLHTGDVGRLDKDGFLYILDRLKDMINRGGEKIYCLGIEALVVALPEVKQAAMFGIPDEIYGEVPAMAVVPQTGRTIHAETIILYLKDKIAKYQLPTQVIVLDKLPSSANGKVLKGRLLEDFLASKGDGR